jgi:hypothetical protein
MLQQASPSLHKSAVAVANFFVFSYGVASSYSNNVLWGLIQVVVQDLTAIIGVQCTPIIGGGSCNQQPVCCTGNNYRRLLLSLSGSF